MRVSGHIFRNKERQFVFGVFKVNYFREPRAAQREREREREREKERERGAISKVKTRK